MKKKLFTGIMTAIVFLLISWFTLLSFTTKKIVNDIWKQLGLTEQQGKENISNSFLTGYMQYFGAGNIRNIATGDRAAIAGDLLNYVKLYVATSAFQREYKQYRNGEKAKIYPVQRAITKEELTKKKLNEAENTLKTFQDLLQTTTDPAIKKSYNEQVDYWKKAIDEYKTPHSSQINYELQMDDTRYKNEKQVYDEGMKKWEAEFPESHLQFIKQRLNAFLEATKDVDYKAALAEKNGKKIFVNPVYERKNSKWKMAFRAGKEVTESARTFATQWLKELN